MHRFFVDEIDGDTAGITGDDLTHLSRVLRLKKGDALTLSDGRGMDYEARIESISREAATCRILESRRAETEPSCRVTLFQCLPKAGKLESVIQKCTELGASAVVPVVSRFCVALPKDFENKLPRLRRVAYEAAKQSRRALVPTVGEPVDISALRPADFDLMLAAYERETARTLKSALRGLPQPPRSAALVIGPEGGFAPEEITALTDRGALSVSLGKRILRTETAGPAMLAQLLYEAEA